MGSLTGPEPKTCHNTLNICAILQHCPQHGASLADSQHAIPLAIPAKTWSVIGCQKVHLRPLYMLIYIKKTAALLKHTAI
jgi:hypothetical protein